MTPNELFRQRTQGVHYLRSSGSSSSRNATETPLTGTSEDRPQPAPYELGDQMDVTEDLAVQDPEASGVVLTDEQLAEELYSPQTGP